MSELPPTSESIDRVAAALLAARHPHSPVMLNEAARTAQQAADALGVQLGQIAKSIVFKRKPDGVAVLVIAAGDRRVDEVKVMRYVCADGQKLGRADAAFVRESTGFAIGGVSPIGHITPPVLLLDDSLFRFERVWAAAGHPHAVFQSAVPDLVRLSGARVVDVAEEVAGEPAAVVPARVLNDGLAARWDLARRLQPQGVPSPCVGVCTMQIQGTAATGDAQCAGCWRTLDEIASWGRMSDNEKSTLWNVLFAREDAQFGPA